MLKNAATDLFGIFRRRVERPFHVHNMQSARNLLGTLSVGDENVMLLTADLYGNVPLVFTRCEKGKY